MIKGATVVVNRATNRRQQQESVTPQPVFALLSTVLAVLLAMWSILPMGWSAAIGSLAQSVSVESSPLGSWPVELFMPVESGLAHSKTYEDDRCLARMREWCELSAGLKSRKPIPKIGEIPK